MKQKVFSKMTELLTKMLCGNLTGLNALNVEVSCSAMLANRS